MCGVSRLLGCYYLYPQVIPLPSTKSITLPPYTNFLVMATHGLWKYLTQKEIYKCIRSFRDPNLCSKKLADLAIASGCPLDVSVVVVKITLGEDLVDSKNMVGRIDLDSSIDMIQEEDEEEAMEMETNTVTNIDDLLEDSFADNIEPLADQSYLESQGLKMISPDQLDALVNKDMALEELEESSEEEDDEELIRDGSYLEQDKDEVEELKQQLRLSIASGKSEDYNLLMSLEQSKVGQAIEGGSSEDEGDISSSDESVSSIEYEPRHQVILAKSVPEIKAEYEMQIKEDTTGVNPVLKNINVAISNIGSEEEDDILPEEEREMMHRLKGGNVKRKRSFVQSAYNRLSRHAFDSGTSFHSL